MQLAPLLATACWLAWTHGLMIPGPLWYTTLTSGLTAGQMAIDTLVLGGPSCLEPTSRRSTESGADLFESGRQDYPGDRRGLSELRGCERLVW